VKACQDIPGQELFQYLNEEGQREQIDSEDVNEYLREISGSDFTAKDFRTWAGTILAAMALQEFAQFDSEAQGRGIFCGRSSRWPGGWGTRRASAGSVTFIR